jgi:hypothetical protein
MSQIRVAEQQKSGDQRNDRQRGKDDEGSGQG